MNLKEFGIFLENRIEELENKVGRVESVERINYKVREILRITYSTLRLNRYMKSSLSVLLGVGSEDDKKTVSEYKQF